MYVNFETNYGNIKFSLAVPLMVWDLISSLVADLVSSLAS